MKLPFVCFIVVAIYTFGGCTVVLPLAGAAGDALHPTTVASTNVDEIPIGAKVTITFANGDKTEVAYRGVELETAAIVLGSDAGSRSIRLSEISRATITADGINVFGIGGPARHETANARGIIGSRHGAPIRVALCNGELVVGTYMGVDAERSFVLVDGWLTSRRVSLNEVSRVTYRDRVWDGVAKGFLLGVAVDGLVLSSLGITTHGQEFGKGFY